MKRQQTSIDGFVPRRSGTRLGELHAEGSTPLSSRTIHSGSVKSAAAVVGVPRPNQVLGRSDIDESLREIDDPTLQEGKKSRRQRRKDKKLNKKPLTRKQKIIRGILISFGVILFAIGAFFVYNLVANSSKVLQGNIFDLAQNEPLKEDANGRSNFVIFGTAEDSEGGTHEGGNLTDSIMVVSINQTKDDAYMLSIPRDLWVKYETVCPAGFQGKINEVYNCASDAGEDEAAGAAALQRKVGEVTGLDIQYFVHLNFTAVEQAVDAVGGVEVVIESDDPRGIFDDNFDWRCNYTCNFVKYPNGPTGTIDGEHALALARARGASGNTYGLPNANFDREKNQQKIIKSLREKALSAGTLANPIAVSNLMNALGNNLRTNIQTKEVQTLAGLGQDIPSEKIIQLTLVETDNMLVMNDRQGAQSIVRPVAGLLDYSDIAAYVNENVNATDVSREKAHVSVLNGGRAAGVAQTEADKLSDLGIKIDLVSNAPDDILSKVEIYQISSDKTATAAKLQELYGVTLKTTAPPTSVVGETDFLIILGPES